jgi:mRNA-degrading endonuclease RelE of RelBE toxin-antitoxin system
MKIRQSRSFGRKVKRFKKQDKKILDKQIQEILDSPNIGQGKKGDLRGVYVYKFKIHTIQYLLSYRFVGDDLELIIIGPHENYYRDLKTYLKNRKEDLG